MITFSELGRYGRLGNQLFQIAATLGIANKNNDLAVFPKWFCNYTGKDMSTFFKNPINESFTSNEVYQPYPEAFFHYTPIIYSNDEKINLHGYFQSYKYWEHCEELIKFHFEPAQWVTDKLLNKYGEILKYETCSIHVRKGDYVNNHVHDVCDIHYYNRAIERMKKEKNIEKFVVFSDNIKWCKERFPQDFIFIENNLIAVGADSIHRTNDTDVEELFLMSMCKNNIIANSSFSLWGAELSKHENKCIIAPKLWFDPNTNLDTKDLLRESWIKI